MRFLILFCMVMMKMMLLSGQVQAQANRTPAPTTTSPVQIYVGNDKTLTHLQVTGTIIKWYSDAAGGAALPTSTVLSNGSTYFASQTVKGLESDRISVTVHQIADAEQIYCASDLPTVANLRAQGYQDRTAQWYSTAIGGTALDGSEDLQSGTYYVEFLAEVDFKFQDFLTGLSFPKALIELNDGRILVGGYNGSGKNDETIYQIDPNTKEVTPWASDRDLEIYSMTQLGNGEILVAMKYDSFDNGVVRRYSSSGERLSPDFTIGYSLQSSIIQTSFDKVLISEFFSGKIWQYDLNGKNKTLFADSLIQPSQLQEAHDGTIWVAGKTPYTNNGHLVQMNRQGKKLREFDIGRGPFEGLVELPDRTWLATDFYDDVYHIDINGNLLKTNRPKLGDLRHMLRTSSGLILVAGFTSHKIHTITPPDPATNRVAVKVTVENPVAPEVAPITYTYGDTPVALTANATPLHSLRWYDEETGGTGNASAPTPLTSAVGTQRFWVSQVTANGCESPRAQIDVQVTPATLNVNVHSDQQKVYGASDPTFYSFDPVGFKYSDDESILTGALTRATGEDVGHYPIALGNLSAGPNYTIEFQPANFEITQAVLNIIVDSDQQKVYGASDPTVYSFDPVGFKYSDDESILTGALTREVGLDAGHYPILIGGLDAGPNYSIKIQPEDFEITQAVLNIIVDSDQQKVYGASDPTVYSFDPVGFKYSDDESILTGALTREVGEDVGHYPILIGGLDAGPNYSIKIQPEDFEIIPAVILGISLSDGSFVYNGKTKSLAIAGTLPVGASVSYSDNSRTNAGRQTVTANIDGGNNYESFSLTAELKIRKAVISGITLSDGDFVYDGTVKSLAIAGTLPDGAWVSYYDDSRTNVGRQTVMANVDGGNNYESFSLTAELEVTKAVISGIALSDGSFVYDGKAKLLSIAGSLPAGASVSYTDNSRTNAGVQMVTANINGGNNYKDLALTAELAISRAEFSGLIFNNKTVTYDRKSQRLELLGAPSGSKITYTGNGQTDVSTYTVTAKVTHSNYVEKTLTATLIINKARQQIAFEQIGTVGRNANRVAMKVNATSDLPVTVVSNDHLVATVSDSDLLIHRLGTVRLTATQAGDNNYEAAEAVSITVYVGDETEGPIRVHQALSPDGDGINDFLIIEGIKDYTENKLQIVTRNGLVVFEIQGYDNDSKVFSGIGNKGGANGTLPSGTYFYLLEYKDGGERKVKKGWFVLRM